MCVSLSLSKSNKKVRSEGWTNRDYSSSQHVRGKNGFIEKLGNLRERSGIVCHTHFLLLLNTWPLLVPLFICCSLVSSSSSLLSLWHPCDFYTTPSLSLFSLCPSSTLFQDVIALELHTHKVQHHKHKKKVTLFNKQATGCVRVRKLLVAPLISLPFDTHTHTQERTVNCLNVWMSPLRVIHTHTHIHLSYTLHPPTWTGCSVKGKNPNSSVGFLNTHSMYKNKLFERKAC